MKVIETSLPGVLLIELVTFRDDRGFFVELFQHERYAALGIVPTLQDNFSRSSRGTLRGLHFQEPHPQGKLVQAISGTIFDVAVDIRRGSPTFGKWEGFELSGDQPRQLWVPPGFAHGFCVTSEGADVLYKTSERYVPAADRGIRWNDPQIGVRWPCEAPRLSAKDAAAPMLREAPMLPQYAPPRRE
jgi:dTDP-4-dehydrorhamnose 3,5-epimerase